MNLSLDLKIRILNMAYLLILSLFNQLECPTWNFLQKIEVAEYFYVIKEKIWIAYSTFLNSSLEESGSMSILELSTLFTFALWLDDLFVWFLVEGTVA